ncbi:hypothetical protein [uncultured Dysosmobacter sp.]|uniref:hypothetical protein n=1 Tax=uncultured Dysosmobacter sp. TaxID=2591384 RepID=UPI0026260CAB|nr:hypothetical protein [uncultured Dysosmobacter sp.]
MERDIEIIKKELESLPTSFFITKWILEHTPYIFDTQETEYIRWREGIAQKLRIDPADILITGSASLGFSLNPNKNFKAFNEKSDVDVSIISHHYFDVAWHDLIYTSRTIIQPKMREALDDHRKRLIYWGTIATDKILPLLSFGTEWDNIIKQSKSYPLLENRNINFRIYKDKLAVRNYLAISVDNRKNALLEEKLR